MKLKRIIIFKWKSYKRFNDETIERVEERKKTHENCNKMENFIFKRVKLQLIPLTMNLMPKTRKNLNFFVHEIRFISAEKKK